MDSVSEMLRNKRILLVDDEPELLEIWRESFLAQQADVSTASDGQEAWERFREGAFDLVITDIRMPKMTGIELLEKIRQQHSSDFPVILVSGYVYDGWIADNSLSEKPNAFFAKPIKPASLLSAAARLLQIPKAA